ncbi:UNVERIFIED_CONTAM: hypothetical protein Slati_1167100 [Sesamum latifolium]|uniref:Reverse transcriptase zinc-binding domain-containing protein n=1 Tax=Sesamum latifolium TaxID=2727402 RepID=A0AAW2XJ03_9LAMI
MSCFRLPDTFLLELESLMANFFWNYGSKSKIHWVTWAKLCTSKEKGGLGFRRLKEFNLALLAKQAWRVALGPSSLLNAILSNKYFPNSSFFDSRGWLVNIDNGAPLDSETRLLFWISKKFDPQQPGDQNLWPRTGNKRGVFPRESLTAKWQATSSLACLVWAISGLAWGSIDCAQSSTEHWLREVHRRLGGGNWDLFLTICWSLWKARNLHIFKGVPLGALDIVRQATRIMNCTWSSPGVANSSALVMKF